jgi:DMSO/TMAO reductase YedYZ molybdopterin-dependent catalytic subunit
VADRPLFDRYPEAARSWDRRQFLQSAAAGTAVVALGGVLWRLAADDLTRKARAEKRTDGRPRLPPGQRVLSRFKNMGGDEGPGDVKSFRLRVHGAVATPFTLDYASCSSCRRSSSRPTSTA